MPTVELALGPIDYRVFGPEDADSPVAVFVHGFLVNGSLWDGVAERLANEGVRSIVPDWPLGAHVTPVPGDVELTPATIAAGILEMLEELDLHDVVLVGNDSGGGLSQMALAGERDRIGALVLTNCDAFETFPPKFFVPLFLAARMRPAVWTIGQTMRQRWLRHSPLAFGPLLGRPRPADLTHGWMQPLLHDAAIRRDITRFARGLRRNELVHAADWLADFDRPTRIVWGTRDRHFHVRLARRLVDVLPNATLTEVPDATTFVPVDRPDTVADAVLEVIAASAQLGDARAPRTTP